MTLVPVTKEHFAEGVPEDCASCPVALALGEHFQLVNVERDYSWSDATGAIRHGDEVRWLIDDLDEWGEDAAIADAAPDPVTLVLDDGQLMTISEWQKFRRSGVRRS